MKAPSGRKRSLKPRDVPYEEAAVDLELYYFVHPERRPPEDLVRAEAAKMDAREAKRVAAFVRQVLGD